MSAMASVVDPVTSVEDPVSWDPPLPGGWSRDFRLGEWLGDPVTPLFESWLLTRIEDRMHRYYGDLLGVALPKPGHVIINGWYFYGLNFMPSQPRQMAFLIVRHLLPRLVTRPRRTAIAFPPLARFAIDLYEREWRTELRPRYVQTVDRGAAEVGSAAPPELAAIIDELADAAGDYFTSVTTVAGFASKSQLPLAAFYTAHLVQRIGGSHLDLLAALDDHPTATPPHAVRSLDWHEPTLGERRVAGDDRDVRRHAEARAGRVRAESTARAALGDRPKLLRRFERLLAEAQRYAKIREELVAEFTLPWPTLRAAVQRLGAALATDGIIDGSADVFFLTRPEVDLALAGAMDPRSTDVRRRRRDWESQRRLAPPLRIGDTPPMIQGFIDAAERTVRGTDLPHAGDIVGIPASSGRARGPARIVHSLDEFDRVQPGDVLVAPMTAPAWTPLFDRVAAIVTDTGGVAAHASIIAREYGLPAVVGTTNATSVLRDGEMIEVDGGTGVVMRIGS